MSSFLRILPPLFFIALGAFAWWISTLPEDMKIERSLHVEAEPQAVFERVAYIRRWEGWFVGQDQEVRFQGPDGGPGGVLVMTVEERDVTLVLTETSTPSAVRYQFWEGGPDAKVDADMKTQGEIAIAASDGGATVSIIEEAHIGGTFGRWMVYLLGDFMVGSILERQLHNLKSALETGASHG
ncbi:MAG: SRPBCC family protein [Myxococcota bacterium]